MAVPIAPVPAVSVNVPVVDILSPLTWVMVLLPDTDRLSPPFEVIV